ncbi:ArsI/CadI family heavy metal resistance metalloenzyme [Kangiella shandongensis]|uniref:ArsI/CadI family heavy metal resistance metalloenzyme n=1 Tax=Kangiella shandongensis TaxID=2763258 RepID=UPI001CBFAE1C|nr:ArsI/CadI family heavy metal resistance metalloenzyme [Kangiella shandongensis]
MKRIHLHLTVSDLESSTQFYSTLFGQTPTVAKEDYIKWSLDEPSVNFAISNRSTNIGLDHLGVEVDSTDALLVFKDAAESSKQPVKDDLGASCCYAQSNKFWVKDPDNISWELFHSLKEIPTYAQDSFSGERPSKSCC